jgi:hypothetical protein
VPLIFLTLLSNANSHAIIIKTIFFREITYVKFELFCIQSLILYAEVKPLVVTSRVGVMSHVQIILKIAKFYHHVEITTFKHRVELKFIIQVNFRVHSYKTSYRL